MVYAINNSTTNWLLICLALKFHLSHQNIAGNSQFITSVYASGDVLELLILLPHFSSAEITDTYHHMLFCAILEIEPQGLMCAGQTLYQLSYIPAPKIQISTTNESAMGQV